MVLLRIKHREKTRQLAFVLVLLFVAQMLFPMQLHTRLVQDNNGVPIIVCTLDGYRHQTLDLNSAHQSLLTDQIPSAAMLFSDLLSQASGDIPVVSFGRITVHSYLDLPQDVLDPALPTVRRSQIRGPPLV